MTKERLQQLFDEARHAWLNVTNEWIRPMLRRHMENIHRKLSLVEQGIVLEQCGHCGMMDCCSDIWSDDHSDYIPTCPNCDTGESITVHFDDDCPF